MQGGKFEKPQLKKTEKKTTEKPKTARSSDYRDKFEYGVNLITVVL